VAGGPNSVAAGDLRGNGIADLVTGNGAGTVSVLLGNGDGTFRAPVSYTASGDARSVAIGDLNGDGIPDLVAASDYPVATVSVLLGHGDGTFQSAETYGNGDGLSVVLADLRRHGALDIVTACADGGGSAGVLLNNGDGTFPLAATYSLNSFASSVAVGDLRGIGTNDLVTTAGGVKVLLGNGDGSFQTPVTYPGGSDPSGVRVADLRGNGIADLVVTTSAGKVGVLLGNGDGTFQGVVQYDSGPHTDAVAVADLNGDGIPDIVATTFESSTDGNVSILFGNGDGSFQAPVVYPLGVNSGSVAVADVNGDGFPDIVTANSSNDGGTISVLLGNGDGTFQRPAFFDVSPDPASTYVAVGDFRGNGILDVAVADGPLSNGSGYMYVLLGNGDGTFQAPVSYPIASRPFSASVADLTGDGRLDLITTDGWTVWVLLGNGNGSFGPPIPYPGGYSTYGVAVGDLAGKGRADLAVTNANGHSLRVMLNDGNWTSPRSAPRLSSNSGMQAGDQDALNAELVTAGAGATVRMATSDTPALSAVLSLPQPAVRNSGRQWEADQALRNEDGDRITVAGITMDREREGSSLTGPEALWPILAADEDPLKSIVTAIQERDSC
jgi:hypothetical protein